MDTGVVFFTYDGKVCESDIVAPDRIDFVEYVCGRVDWYF